MYKYTTMLLRHFSEENFCELLFASLRDEAFSEFVLHFQERFFSPRRVRF